jgi:diacylglycerol O-acyltransferase
MASSQPIPLGPEDRAILELESATIAGHTCKVVRLGAGAPDVARLRERIAERISLAPLLTRRLGGAAGAPAWVLDEDFDVARHVVAAEVAAPLDRRGVLELVARRFEQRLERDRPLWRIDVAPCADGGGVLVWRIHHALADGTASMRYARALLWDERADAPAPRDAASAARQAAADDARRRAHLAGFLKREFAPSRVRSPFDGRIGTRREIGFAAVRLGALREAAHRLAGATVNDAVLCVVAGALRRWVEHHHGELGEIRARIPVSLHHEGDDAANRDSFFSIGLRLWQPDPVVRLRRIHAQTAERKAAQDARLREQLLEELRAVSPSLRRFAARVERSPRQFALSISNVPGPRAPVAVLGAPVARLHSLAEIGERHALRASAVSVADLLCIGFCADPAIVDDVQVLADGVEAEAAALIAAAA